MTVKKTFDKLYALVPGTEQVDIYIKRLNSLKVRGVSLHFMVS